MHCLLYQINHLISDV